MTWIRLPRVIRAVRHLVASAMGLARATLRMHLTLQLIWRLGQQLQVYDGTCASVVRG